MIRGVDLWRLLLLCVVCMLLWWHVWLRVDWIEEASIRDKQIRRVDEGSGRCEGRVRMVNVRKMSMKINGNVEKRGRGDEVSDGKKVEYIYKLIRC